MQESNLNQLSPDAAALVGQCRDAAVACLPSAFAVTLGDALNGLIEARPWVGPDSAIELYEQAIGVLRHRRGDLEAAFRERYAALSDPAGDKAGQTATAPAQRPGLMDEDVHYDFAAPETLAQAIATACKGELYSLERRLDAITGTRGWRQSPVAPQLIGAASIEAMRQAGLVRAIRQSLLPLLAEYLPQQVKPVYQALNQFLLERQVLPELKLGLPAKGQAGTVAAVCQNWLMRQSLSQPTPSQGQTLAQVLAGWRHGDAEAARLLGLDAGALAAGMAILRRIEQAASLQLSAADRVALDWAAGWFEARVFTAAVPADWQVRIGRLQLVVLRAALQDAEGVLRQGAHPVRQLLDALIVLAGCEAAQTVAVKAEVATLIEGLQQREDNLAEGFRQALAALPGLDPAAAVDGASQFGDAATAEAMIRHALEGRRIPGAMESFLLMHGPELVRQTDATEAAQILADLIGSLEPAGWRQRREELAAALPGLLKRLQGLMAQANLASEVRGKFFGDLVKCHATLMRATRNKTAETKANPDSKVA
ncbi:uncharacterized protein DUF1631 [Sulfuritortus calidifontis]|uniref:Uncharacterized protein DUF1631 n=1 Tax=Sulfuritortus calidifontis TaxID=1914471 RepID=A0A4R3K088_9PROT|nr:DUF1631 family protein [Sulfuritortus calidifontis]TCS72986.1 uncharacterized protein DUF1631 [Sulfuritortus calidifontis]